MAVTQKQRLTPFEQFMAYRRFSAGLAFSAYTCIGPDDEVIGLRPTRLPPEPREGLLNKPFARLMDHMPTNTTCVMVRKSVLDELGVFDTGLYIGEDWDLWYRIAKRYDVAYTLDASLARQQDSHLMQFSACSTGRGWPTGASS